jgi:hypothetical protein
MIFVIWKEFVIFIIIPPIRNKEPPAFTVYEVKIEIRLFSQNCSLYKI